MPGIIGLYIHVPFCISKCPYCDFYSLTGQSQQEMESYTNAVIGSLEEWSSILQDTAADTLYFGGGTPSLLGGIRLSRIIETATRCFGLKHAEITMEANPGDSLDEVFSAFSASGGNRVSLGMQSADAEQLGFLGRRHNPQDVHSAVAAAHSAGIDNISVDLMLGLKNQSINSIITAASESFRLGVKHVSAYMLKIEEGTPFYHQRDKLSLPDDDDVAELYLAACQTLEALGYKQYEISNFAIPGYESRHNLKYWNADPYLGIGPSAHSYIGGKRFFFPHDTESFIKGNQPISERGMTECDQSFNIWDASEHEYMMLRLRLTEGLTNEGYRKRFGHPIPTAVYERAAGLPNQLLTADTDGIRFNKFGFLLSNTIIARLIEE